jgi:YopX protein.
MREIKFRFWDMKRKRFIDDCDVYFVGENCILAGDFNNPPVLDITENVLVSEFTGLKDSNDVPIYEGDIVISIGSKDKVVYKDGAFYLESLLKRPQSDELLSEIIVEVVGNIYETPHLLNK